MYLWHRSAPDSVGTYQDSDGGDGHQCPFPPFEQYGQAYRRVMGNRSPSKRWQNTSASSGFLKQNTTNSLSPPRSEYGRGAADRVVAKPHTTSLFLTPRTLSAGKATWCGHLRLI